MGTFDYTSIFDEGLNLDDSEDLSVDTSTLNPEQLKVVRSITDIFDSTIKSVIGLQGAGGTGKTYTASFIIKSLRRLSSKAVIGLAPSNEAKNLLTASLGVSCRTVASFLKKSPEYDELGVLQFFSGSLDENPFDKYKIVIVDEASMLSLEDSAEIFALFQASTCRLLLLMYDKYQHLPIGEGFSSAITRVPEGCEYELTIQQRQTEGNPISDLIAESRQAVIDTQQNYDPRYHFRKTKLNDVEHGMIYEKRDKCVEAMADLFNTSYQTGDFYLCRAIAFRNKTVEKLNKQIREKLLSGWSHLDGYQKNLDFLPGELLICKKPVMRLVYDANRGKDVTVTVVDNAAACLIHEINYQIHSLTFEYTHYGTTQNDTIKKSFDFEYYEVVVKPIRTGITVSIKLPTLESKEKWLRLIETIRKNVVHSQQYFGKDFVKKQRLWGKFYNLNETFNDFQHGYAINSHQSQGNSFTHIYVDCNDISSIPDADSASRGFYVALSRAKETIRMSKD